MTIVIPWVQKVHDIRVQKEHDNSNTKGVKGT